MSPDYFVTDVTDRSSRPLLAELLQASFLQILGAHQNAKFATGLEVEKERFCKGRHI
jgi:hypothetical protein